MRVVTKQPGQPARIEDLRGDLESLQRAVGGYIEMVPLRTFARQHLYCNEEGKLNGLPPCIVHPSGDGVICGPVVVSKTDQEGNEIGLSESEAEIAIDFLAMLEPI